MTAIKTGVTAAIIDKIVDTRSSAILTGTLPAPPVETVTAGLTANDFTACTVPATNNPITIAKTG
jgi:hypothetical protein